ncbi:MAG TPA: ribosome-associated translation inhibitor RaiA [Vicinamibacterales bacterium]|nr:ribosome-associated translation inhibitor RaiA [Vicinamibacterales bacterium]
MRLELTGRHVEITPTIRNLIDRKIAKLARVLNDSAVSAQVVLTREKYRHVTEISVHMRGDHILAGKTSGETWTDSVGRAIVKIEQQAQKVKGKWVERKRRATSARVLPPPAPAAPAEEVGPTIVRASRYHVKPLSLEEAARAVEQGRDGFLVFRNAHTGEINVLYRRKDGDLGLIEPER